MFTSREDRNDSQFRGRSTNWDNVLVLSVGTVNFTDVVSLRGLDRRAVHLDTY